MLLHILEQFKNLLQLLSRKNSPVRGHITVTGGEPFVRSDFFDLLEIFSRNKKLFSFAILTNGSFIDALLAKKLKKLNPAFIQVSLEGKPETHDRIRGQGNYEKTVQAIRHLVKQGICTYISFTAHKDNFREFHSVARKGRRLGVQRVWADRLIPHGCGAMIRDRIMTSDENRDFLLLMNKERRKTGWFRRRKTEVSMHRALQFLVAGGQPYKCTAGNSLITIMPDGDLYPCRRMPVSVGNVLENSLADLYENSELFRRLRDRKEIPAGCSPCLYKNICRGGLKCLSYAVSGDPFAGDPSCWIRE